MLQREWCQAEQREANLENIENSKSYSLRTLTTLHNMSKNDAEIFTKVCSHIITVQNFVFIPRYDNSVKETFVSYQEIIHLSECGLLNLSPMISLKLGISNNHSTPAYVFNDNYVLFVSSKKNKDVLQIPQYPLTISGVELASLFE